MSLPKQSNEKLKKNEGSDHVHRNSSPDETDDGKSTPQTSQSPTSTAVSCFSSINTKENPKNKCTTRYSLCVAPKMKSVIYMTLSMAVHFSGHEFARGPTSSMFTSKDFGFRSSAALPLAVGCVSPFSIFLLWSFAKMLKKYGPRYALRQSTLCGALYMLMIGICLHQITSNSQSESSINILKTPKEFDPRTFTKVFLFALFVFQSANVQFLYTQHWSFLGSILTPEEGKVWFAPIAGFGSITSTLAAANVSRLVDRMGLIGLLCTAAIVIGSSAFFADKAYQIARENGFEPQQHNMKGKRNKIVSKENCTNDKGDDTKETEDAKLSSASSKDDNIVQSTLNLFQRVPILGAMFCEVILSQCFSSLLNFQFMVKVKDTILDDSERAGWTGGCYAWVNGMSGVMQFFILPIVTKRIHASRIWIFMPTSMLMLCTLQVYSGNPSLELIGFTFLTLKTIEYSLRGQVNEMVFASLDYESRFVGKEMINLFANRLGKSGMAISLFLLTTYMEKDGIEVKKFLIFASNLIACLWLFATVRLSRFIKTKVATK